MDINKYFEKVGRKMGITPEKIAEEIMKEVLDLDKLKKLLDDGDGIIEKLDEAVKNAKTDGEVSIKVGKESSKVYVNANAGQTVMAFIQYCRNLINESEGMISKELLIYILISRISNYKDK